LKYVHSPVLLDYILSDLVQETDSYYLDCTLGEGGHTEAILNRYQNIKACGLDRDSSVLQIANERLAVFGERFSSFNINFNEAGQLKESGLQFDCALIDLGISVFHYKSSGRGFTFLKDEPLDMRLDSEGTSVEHIINTYSEKELKDIFYKYAEERFTPNIVKRIMQSRIEKPITSSLELATIIENAIPHKFRSRNIHPATKVFQALRIVANNELDNITKGIPQVLSLLKKGGRLGVITFHSIEDRIVKKIFAELNKECLCPPKLPICSCGKVREVKIIGKSIIPTETEIENNPPSRSARLRIVEKL